MASQSKIETEQNKCGGMEGEFFNLDFLERLFFSDISTFFMHVLQSCFTLQILWIVSILMVKPSFVGILGQIHQICVYNELKMCTKYSQILQVSSLTLYL